MNKKYLSTLVLALASSTALAGTMGPIVEAPPTKYLILEGGFAYSHAFYKDSFIAPESRAIHPAGISINPEHFYPEDFYGGYIGSSLFMSNWLLNMRYSIYSNETKRNNRALTTINIAPAKLSFTADKVFGDFHTFSYGVGAGATVETVNKGSFIVATAANNPPSESIQGRTRIDPLVEAFAMYRFNNNVGVKANVEYQIPAHSHFSNGDINVNLGVNWAVPV